jgi:hypothetical protein
MPLTGSEPAPRMCKSRCKQLRLLSNKWKPTQTTTVDAEDGMAILSRHCSQRNLSAKYTLAVHTSSAEFFRFGACKNHKSPAMSKTCLARECQLA